MNSGSRDHATLVSESMRIDVPLDPALSIEGVERLRDEWSAEIARRGVDSPALLGAQFQLACAVDLLRYGGTAIQSCRCALKGPRCGSARRTSSLTRSCCTRRSASSCATGSRRGTSRSRRTRTASSATPPQRRPSSRAAMGRPSGGPRASLFPRITRAGRRGRK